MKRFVSALTALLLAAVSLAFIGCKAKGPVGRYSLDTIGGTKLTEALDQLAAMYGMSVESYVRELGADSVDNIEQIELRSDGTYEWHSVLYPSEKGEWKQEGDKLTINIGADVVDVKIENNTLSFINPGDGMEYVFIRK